MISQVTLVRENHEPQNVVVPEPVDRRFRDFVWLEESLHDDVPGAILPVLPDKDFPVAAQNKGFLEARATACTVFLTTIISNPEVCDSDVARTRVHMFLSGNAAELDRLKQRTKALAKDQAAEAPAEEAKKLVHSAIMAGINNDLGSGGSVDMLVITPEGTETLRNYARPNERKFRKAGGYQFPKGTAKVLSQKFVPLTSLVTIETEVRPVGMETS